MGCWSETEGHTHVCVAFGDAVQDVVSYCLAGVSAFWASWGVDFGDTVEVVVVVVVRSI